MVYGDGAIAERFRSDSRPLHSTKGTAKMATKICGFPSRRWAAFFLGMLIGTVVVGCSMFGPGLGVSVY